MSTLLAVPNVSEGREEARIAELRTAFAGPGVELLDQHTDADHNRTVFTLAGSAAALVDGLVAGGTKAGQLIDMRAHHGAHPCIGALDVAPIVYPRSELKGEALEAGNRLAAALGEAGLPVFLYGDLVQDQSQRERAFFRRGGVERLGVRVAEGELVPDFGPAEIGSAGAVLVTARPPMGAFNVELDRGGLQLASIVAGQLRESGGGLAGVRAIGIELSGGVGQVSTNVEDPLSVPLGAVVERIRVLAGEHGARPSAGELIGLIPEAALVGYPEDVPIRGFDSARHVIERRI